MNFTLYHHAEFQDRLVNIYKDNLHLYREYNITWQPYKINTLNSTATK